MKTTNEAGLPEMAVNKNPMEEDNQMKNEGKRALLMMGIAVMITIITGCTQSLPVTYNSEMTLLGNADEISKYTVGIAKFVDKRSWVDSGDANSESYIAMQSPWKFGLSYQGKEYIPVKDLMQIIFVDEFNKAGFNAKPINFVLSKHNIKEIRNISAGDKVDYVLGGEILVFEFVNDAGVWTVESRRSLLLNLTMVKSNGEEVRLDTSFNETDRENEGMGVMHGTNVDKLMNRVVKKVVGQIVHQVAEKLALNYKDVYWKISLNGKAYDYNPNS